MAAKKQWWKHGDSPHVAPRPADEYDYVLCNECSQAFIGHGQVEDQIVHPGDFIITHNGGAIEVVHPDPFAGLEVRP